MTKNNFLLVDLNESQTKKLAETITSETSRRILNSLAEKDEAEANMAKELNLPISTVHYHLQKLMETKLVVVNEFHYSPKGREVNHYKLANKYIIIAPKKVSGLKEKLRGILPVGLIVLGISAVIKAAQLWGSRVSSYNYALAEKAVVMEEAGREAVAEAEREAAVTTQQMITDTVPEAAELVQETTAPAINTVTQQPDIAFWFLVGSLTTLAIYVLVILIRNWKKNKS